MERNRSVASSIEREPQSWWMASLQWWYRYFAPAEPSATASLSQRERARRGRLASLTMLIFILFLLSMLPEGIMSKSSAQTIATLVGEGGCFFALFLNRRGFVEIAGILALVLLYAGLMFTMLSDPSGLTVRNLSLLDFAVVPDVLVLAFFSARSLFPVVCINVFVTWALVMYGPHDATITSLLHSAPMQIFAHAYILQLFTAAALYLWARSTEQALKRADRAEEIIAYEKSENERKQRGLEQKRQLDAGIQQLLQTHVAVANGDFKARAPLSQDHMLWQVAVALNNLIARLQSLSYIEGELKQQVRKENERTTDHHARYKRIADHHVGDERATDHHPATERTTDHHHAAYEQDRTTPPKASVTTHRAHRQSER